MFVALRVGSYSGEPAVSLGDLAIRVSAPVVDRDEELRELSERLRNRRRRPSLRAEGHSKLERGAVDPEWVSTGRRGGTVAGSAASATTAHKAMLELAPSVARTGEVEAVHADVLVKLAILNPGT